MIKIEITAETVGEIHGELQALLQGCGYETKPLPGEAKISAPEPEKPKKAKKQEPTPEPVKEPTPEPEETSGVTYDQVKEMALQTARAKKKDEVKAILADAGVVRISDLKESQYAEVYEKLEAL
jgi:outer membrane biosynthesis protein TonB